MIPAIYFDGRSARRHDVRLSIAGDEVRVEGEGVLRCEPRAAVKVSERLGNAPRVLRFADGAFCEVRDHAALEPALDAAGHRLDWVEHLERSWRAALAALLATLAAAVVAYVWLAPAAAELIARDLPPSVARRISDSAMAALDQSVLKPSQLEAPRRAALAARFAALQQADDGAGAPAGAVLVEFRSSPKIGPNAFALPDGRVILLDQLVALAANDDEILGVLAHEAGHVHYRHGMRMLLQGSFVGMAMTAWFGDISSLLAALPTALLETRYSREFESQADDYAARVLQANGIAPAHLADLLERMVAARDKAGGTHKSQPGSYLSSHPPTAERIARLRAASAARAGRP